MVRRWLLILAMLALAPLGRADVTASVDRTTLYSDENLLLTIRADYPEAEEPLDLTALSTLFEIEQQTQSTQSRYSTGGGRERWREWRLWLRPKQTGTLAIPNFKLGDERTEPIFVQVRDAANRQDGLPEDAVILEAELSDESPYVGQPVILTIRLKYQVRLQGTFDSLELNAFEAEQLDESSSVVRENGQQYNQYRLVYRLTSDQAGSVSIPEIRFSGQYQSGQFNSARRLTRAHPGLDLQVQPIPDSYPGDAFWLPAESVSLHDNLSSNLDLTANEHLNWVVTTRVNGLPATRLPNPIADLDGDDFRLYRNEPEFEEGEPLGSRRDMAALVFTEPGTYTLPAVRVPWWNLRTDRLAWAEIPARTVTVTASAQAAVTPTVTEPAGTPTPETAPASPGVWPWVSLSLGIGWVATVLVWIASLRTTSTRRKSPEVKAEPTRQTDWANLKSLARKGQPSVFYTALTTALNRRHRIHLDRLKPDLDDRARHCLEQLEASLYSVEAGAPPETGDLVKLVDTLEHALKREGKKPVPEPTRLYPD